MHNYKWLLVSDFIHSARLSYRCLIATGKISITCERGKHIPEQDKTTKKATTHKL